MTTINNQNLSSSAVSTPVSSACGAPRDSLLFRRLDQVAGARASAGTTYEYSKVRRAVMFLPVLQEILTRAAVMPIVPPAFVARGLETLKDYACAMETLKDELSACGTALEHAPQTFYTVETRAVSARCGLGYRANRGTLGDTVDPNDPRGQAILAAAGVGLNVKFDSPLDVERRASVQVAMLRVPANQAYLEEQGLSPELMLAIVEPSLLALTKAVLHGPASITELRGARERVQLRMEILAGWIMGLVQSLYGPEYRDQLRANWPTTYRKTTQGSDVDAETEIGTDANVTDALVTPASPSPSAPMVHAPVVPVAVSPSVPAMSTPVVSLSAPVTGGATAAVAMPFLSPAKPLLASGGTPTNGATNGAGHSNGVLAPGA